jgi:hypothetical protein
VDGFTIFIESGAPSVFPQTAPVILLLEADHLGDLGSLLLGGLESAERRKP